MPTTARSESFEAADVHGAATAGACLGVAASCAEGFSGREAMSRSQRRTRAAGIAVAAITRRASAASSVRASMGVPWVRHSGKFPNAHVAPLGAGRQCKSLWPKEMG
jgi:hypothetical protein